LPFIFENRHNYGSFAKGSEIAESDVDVMVIGEVSFAEVITAMEDAQKKLGREINPSVYPVKEFSSKLSAGNHFLTSLFVGEKIFLIGDPDELEAMNEKRLAG
jgi:predicted nucleotidyltransferase